MMITTGQTSGNLNDWIQVAKKAGLGIYDALVQWKYFWMGIRDGRLHDSAIYLIDHYSTGDK